MKLHSTVIQKLLRLMELHGGRRENKKLLEELQKVDLTVYTQKENPQHDKFLVLTESVKEAEVAKKR